MKPIASIALACALALPAASARAQTPPAAAPAPVSAPAATPASPLPPADPGMATGPHTFGNHALTDRLPPGTYLSPDALPDTTTVLPPPPVSGSPEQADDDATFARTRALRDTARWALATRDAALSSGAILADFGCALGVRIDPARAPTLVSLLAHAGADMSPEIDRTKQFWGRKRPFIGNDQPVCVEKSPGLVQSPSYPSGHTTLLFGTALILAELAPDHAAAILQRGRTLSESRIVCGVHWLSDVQAGFVEAGSLVAALHGSPAFRADMDRAREELAAIRRTGGSPADAGECAIERDAASHSPLFRLQPAAR